MRPRFTLGLILDDARELVSELPSRPGVDDRGERVAMDVFAMNPEHVETDAEVTEPRLDARAMGATGRVVKLYHLAEEAEASPRQSARSEELDRASAPSRSNAPPVSKRGTRPISCKRQAR